MTNRAFGSPYSTLLFLGAAALTITVFPGRPATAQVKFGFQAPLTGPAATDGVSAKVAAELAVERINASGGVLGQKIELVTYDDQAKTDEAVFRPSVGGWYINGQPTTFFGLNGDIPTPKRPGS